MTEASNSIKLPCCIIDFLLETSFNSLTPPMKKIIVTSDKPAPLIEDFNNDYYTLLPWLAGCAVRKKVFCLPCVMFHFGGVGVWSSGNFEVNKFKRALRRHEGNLGHLQAIVQFQIEVCFSTGNNQFLCDLDTPRHNEKVTRNRRIIERLIVVACYLGTHKLPFHSNDSDDISNYADTVRLLSQYDELLSNHLDSAAECSGLSKQMQNDLLVSLKNTVLEYIKTDIKKAVFVALLLIEMPDCENVATVLRYTLKGKIYERFVDFIDLQGETLATLTQYIFTLVERFNFINKFVAIFYDGAVVPTNYFKQFQNKLNEKYVQILVVHHDTYTFSFIVSQILEKCSIKECRAFFKTVTSMELFFTQNLNDLEMEMSKKLPNVSFSSWTCEKQIITAMFEHRPVFIHMFEFILDNPESWSNEMFNLARGYLSFLNDFDSCFLLCLFSEIFPLISLLSNSLRYKSRNVQHCLEKIESTVEAIHSKREQFQSYWTKANEMTDFVPTSKRLKISTEADATSWYKGLLFEIINCITCEIKQRSMYFHTIDFIELISPINHEQYSYKFPENCLNTLIKHFGDFFAMNKLKFELRGVYSIPNMKNKDVCELLEFIHLNGLNSMFQQTVLLCNLILTLPCTNNLSSSSSTIMNRLKSYCKDAPGQDYYGKLALVFIEQDLLKTLVQHNKTAFVNEVINDMAKYNNRLRLVYK